MFRGIFCHHQDDSDAKNGGDVIVSAKNSITTDKEAPQHRNNGPAPDEEAYVTDEKAVERRNIEPVHKKDEPLYGNNRPAYDEEAALL